MAYQNLLYEKKEGVATITLNRPEALNGMSVPLLGELQECLDEAAADPEARVVVLTGAGRAFCAGGDVRAMREAARRDLVLKRMALLVHNVVATIRRMPKPVVAAVNGVAAGAGFPLVLACDMVIAAEEARFNLAYVNIGLSPDGGSTYFVPRLLGLQRASYLVFTGEFLSASQGLELGFINQVVKREELMAAASALASKLASGPAIALAKGKELINRSLSGSLEAQMECERQAIGEVSRSQDLQEGLEAFFAKRPPQFVGK